MDISKQEVIVLSRAQVIELLKEGGQEMPYTCFRTQDVEYVGQGSAHTDSLRCHFFYRGKGKELYYTYTHVSCG